MPYWTNARSFDRLVRIERKTTTPNSDYGTPVQTWATFAVVRAEWQDVLPSKAEGQTAGVNIARRPARLRMRYLRGVTSDMRVKPAWGAIAWGSRHWWTDSLVYQIVAGPAELGRREGLEMMIQEYSSSGQAS